MEFSQNFSILLNSTLKAISELGGSANKDDVWNHIKNSGVFTSEKLRQPHKADQLNSGSRLEYWADWARTYLKKGGYLENPARGQWRLTDKARQSNCSLSDDDISSIMDTLRGRKTQERSEDSDSDAIAEFVESFNPDFTHKTEADVVAEMYHQIKRDLPQAEIRLNVRTPSGKFLDMLIQVGKRRIAVEVKADDSDTKALAEQMRLYMEDTGTFCLALCGVDDIPVVMVQVKHLFSMDSSG